MRQQQSTLTPSKPSSSKLSTLWRARYPGSYDDLNDDELEQLIVKRYPGSYDDLITPKTTTDTVGTIISQPTLDVPELPEPPKGVSHGPIIDNLWKFGARLGDTASSMFSSTDAQQLAKASHQLKQARLLEEKGTAEAKAARDMQVKQEYSDWGKGLESRIKSPWGIAEAATSAVDPTGFLPSYVGLGEQSVEDIKQKNWGGLGANVTLGAAPFVLPYLRGKVSRAGIPPEYIPEKPNVRVVPPVEPIGQRQLGGQVQANYNAPVDAEFTVGKSRPPRALLGPPSRGLLSQGQPPIVPPVEPVSPIPNQTGIVPRPTTYNPFKADALPPIEELPKDIKQVQGSIVSSRALPPVEPIRQLPTIVPPGNMPPPAALPQRLPLPPVNTDVVGQNLGPVNPADFGPKAQEYLQRWHSGRDIYGHERLPKTFKTAAAKRDEEDFLRSMDWQKEHDQPGLSPRDVSDIVGDVTKQKQEVIGPGGQPLTPRTEKNVSVGRQKQLPYKDRIEEELSKYEETNAKGSFIKPGSRTKIVIPEINMTEADIEDLRAIRKNKERDAGFPEGGDFSDKIKSIPAFKKYVDIGFDKVIGYNEGAVDVRLKDGSVVILGRDDVVGVPLRMGRDYKEAGRGYGHTVMRPDRFDKEGNFIPQESSEYPKAKEYVRDVKPDKYYVDIIQSGKTYPQNIEFKNRQGAEVYASDLMKTRGGSNYTVNIIGPEETGPTVLPKGVDVSKAKIVQGKRLPDVETDVVKEPVRELPAVEQPQDNSLASRWQAQVDELDRTNAPDTDYRDIMSTGSKAGLKKGETWRGRVLKYIDMDKNPRVEPVKEPATGTTTPRFVGAQGTGEGIVYLQFDNRGRIPSVKDVQDMFPDHPNIAITRFKREGSLRPDLTKFRIDTHGVGKGTWGTDSYSSKVEKEIMESVGGRFMEWNTPDPTKVVPEIKELPAVEPVRNTIDEAFARVVDRMDTKGETLNQAIEAVYPDYGGKEFAKQLEAHARMESIDIKDIEPKEVGEPKLGFGRMAQMPPEMEGGLPKMKTPMGVKGEEFLDFLNRAYPEHDGPWTPDNFNALPRDIRNGFWAMYQESQAKAERPAAEVKQFPGKDILKNIEPSEISKKSKKPKDDYFIGVIRGNGSIETKAINPDEYGVSIRHEPTFGPISARQRFTYDDRNGIVRWTDTPNLEDAQEVEQHLMNQGYEVKDQYPQPKGYESQYWAKIRKQFDPSTKIPFKDIEPSKASWFKNPDLKDEHRDFLKKVLGIDDAQIDSLTRDKVTSLIASYNKYKEFEKAYDELVPVKDRRYVIHDAGGRYTQQELDNFNNSPRIIRIADIMENVLGELNTLFPEQLGATEKFGFLLGNKGDGGVNVADPEFIITKKRKTGVLANLFDAIQQEDNPKAASQRFLHYIKHEFTHNLIREEGGKFTWAFAKVDSRLPLESQLNVKRLIHSALTEANGDYAPEIQKLILQHTKARGRADTKVDILSGPAKSPISEFTGQSRISGGDKPDGKGVSKGVTVDADKILEDALRESGVSEEAIQAAIAESKVLRSERIDKLRAKIAAKKLAGQKVNKLEPEVEAGSGGGGAKEPPKPPTTNAPSTPPPPIPPTGKASGKQKGKKVKVPKTVEQIIAAKKAKNAAVPVPTITAAVKALPSRFRNTALYRHIYEPSGVSGLTKLERMGEGGKKLAKLLRDERTESSRAGGEHALITRKVKRNLSKDEWHEVASILDGQKPLEDASSQKIKDAYADLRESTDIQGDEAIASGMRMKTSKGDVVPFEKHKGEYWPHRYPKELFKDTKSLREKLLKAGNSPVVVDAIIKNVIEKGERFSSAQHAREFNLPGYSMEPEALEAHQYEMGRAITRAKRFGPGDVADKDSVISKLIRETDDPARAEIIVNDYLGRVEHNPDMEGQQGLYDKIVTAEVGMHLSQFGLTNMGDLAPMSGALGPGNVFNAINEVIANPHGSVDIGVRTGAHNIIRNELLHDVGAGNLLGKAYGTQSSEKFLRTVGALAGRANVKRLFALAKRKPKYAKMLADFVDGDVNTVLKQDRLTPRQIDFGAARGVELSSGIPDKLTLGKAFFNKNPLLRLPYLFKRFAFVNVRNMINAVKRQPTWAGKLAKAGAIIALYQVAGEGIGDAKATIKGLASGDIEKSLTGRGDYIESKNWPLIGSTVGGKELDRIMANFLQSALFGIVGDVTESIAKRSIGKVTGVAGGPLGSDIDELAYGLGSILYPPKEGNRFAPLGKAIAKKIPYIGAGLAERWEKQKQPTLKGLSP